MSIVINGFDKPDNCLSCPFNHASCYCNITKVEIDRDDYTSSACPITQLPKGHGNLIDADELLKNVQINREKKEWMWAFIGYSDIENAPVIIEANKGSEK